MHGFLVGLFGWMPVSLQILCGGVIALFFFVTILHIVRFILDLLPFV